MYPGRGLLRRVALGTVRWVESNGGSLGSSTPVALADSRPSSEPMGRVRLLEVSWNSASSRWVGTHGRPDRVGCVMLEFSCGHEYQFRVLANDTVASAAVGGKGPKMVTTFEGHWWGMFGLEPSEPPGWRDDAGFLSA